MTGERQILALCDEWVIGARTWGGIGPRRMWKQQVWRVVGTIGPTGVWQYDLPPGATRMRIQ